MTDPTIYHGLLICGMSPSTAGRYLVVRDRIGEIMNRVNSAGFWLEDFENVRSGCVCNVVMDAGRTILHAMADLREYLDEEFVSIKKLRAEADKLTKMDMDG